VALVKPKIVIPMHYGTFPNVLIGTVPDFWKALRHKKLNSTLIPLTPGKTRIF
jgi:hypothetical protein